MGANVRRKPQHNAAEKVDVGGAVTVLGDQNPRSSNEEGDRVVGSVKDTEHWKEIFGVSNQSDPCPYVVPKVHTCPNLCKPGRVRQEDGNVKRVLYETKAIV